MEELILTDPIVIPPTTIMGGTKDSYHVTGLTLNHEAAGPSGVPGFVHIVLKDNTGQMLTHIYEGDQAKQMIKTLNTANMTTKSMHKRILEKLAKDGVIPGTVTGTPDPPPAGDDF